MRYSELLESHVDDDELFGKSRNQIIAQGLYAEAAKERDVAAEERGLGDLRNSHDFAKQAAETEALAREFEVSLHNGMRAWRSIKNGFRRSDFADIVEYHTELNLYDIDKIVSEDADDDELFGAQPLGAKGMIYQVGKQILNQLEQSWSVPAIRTEYNEYQEAGDSDAQFDQVVRITKKPFKQTFVVDTIIREFAGMEGLNDFGWMLNNGQFHELKDAWERFKNDDDIESEDWFQREAQDFMGKRV